MDPELFNHLDKCRLCFVSATQARGEFFKITREVSKRFFRLTQVELKPSRRFSRSVCESCSRNLTSFADFQGKLVRNQQRLLEFDVKANPFVALERLDEESIHALHGSEESHLVDPFYLPDFRIVGDEEIIFEADLEKVLDNLPEAWEFTPYLPASEEEEIEEPQRVNTRERRSAAATKTEPEKIPSKPARVEPKKRKRKVTPAPTKTLPAKNLLLGFSSYEKKTLEGCKFPGCHFMIHPKLVGDHNQIFHPENVKGEPQPKVPEKVSQPFEVCPYCGKVIKSCSIRKHLVRHYDKADELNFQCDLCSYTCVSKLNMWSHMNKVHTIKSLIRYPCSMCDKTFSEKSVVKTHEKTIHQKIQRVHETQRCDVCNLDFKNIIALKSHNARLHDEGNFGCTKCSEVFMFKPQLDSHILSVHEPKVTCHICGKLCKPGPLFSSHMTKHKIKTCPYEGCGKKMQGDGLRNHIQANHTPLNLQCTHCPAVFKTKRGFSKHNLSQHQQNYEALACKVTGCRYEVKRKEFLAEHYKRHKGITKEEKEYLQHHLKSILRPKYNATPLGKKIVKKNLKKTRKSERKVG